MGNVFLFFCGGAVVHSLGGEQQWQQMICASTPSIVSFLPSSSWSWKKRANRLKIPIVGGGRGEVRPCGRDQSNLVPSYVSGNYCGYYIQLGVRGYLGLKVLRLGWERFKKCIVYMAQDLCGYYTKFIWLICHTSRVPFRCYPRPQWHGPFLIT